MADAELVLELLDLAAQWRLRDMQHLRRAGEVPLARHRREVSVLAQLQTIPPRMLPTNLVLDYEARKRDVALDRGKRTPRKRRGRGGNRC